MAPVSLRHAASVCPSCWQLSAPQDYTDIKIDSEDFGAVLLRLGERTRGSFTVSQVSAGRKNGLLIEVYGKNEVIVSGAGEVQATVLAPEAKVTLSGGSTVKGGLVGNEVIMSGGSFAWDERAASLRQEGSGAEAYQRVPSWGCCRSRSS